MSDTLVLRRRFAARLDEAMQAKGWNQTELAKRVGLSQSSISDMLRGRDAPALPNGETLCRLCTALDCSMDWLLLGRGTREGRIPPAGHFFQEGGLAAILELRVTLERLEEKWRGAIAPHAKEHLDDERARAPRLTPRRTRRARE